MTHDDVITALSVIRAREGLGSIDVKLKISPPVNWHFLAREGYVKLADGRYILTFMGHVKLAAEKDKNEPR